MLSFIGADAHIVIVVVVVILNVHTEKVWTALKAGLFSCSFLRKGLPQPDQGPYTAAVL